MNCKPRNASFAGHASRGTSLLEVICAFSVITMGIFATMQVFHTSALQTRALAQEQRAMRLMENAIERMRAEPFGQLVPGKPQPLPLDPPEIGPLQGVEGSAKLTALNELPGAVTVTVELSWNDPHGRRISRSLSSLIADKEIRP